MSLTVVGPADEEHRLAPSGGYDAGEIVQAPSGRVGYVESKVALLENEPAVIRTAGKVKLTAASSATWSAGAAVAVNLTTQAAVTTAPDGSNILIAGRAAEAKVDGQTEVVVLLNDPGPTLESPIEPVVFEFDCDGSDVALHTLLPALENTRGVIVVSAVGRVTEVFAGSTQDQGIVTLTDSDGNTICTLTPSDAAADIVGDVIVGHDMTDLATGGVLKTVAAGKSIRGQVTQPTTGTPAGKMTVHLLLLPLT